MFEHRLNSVHLEFPRRDQFRQARAELLEARGSTTLALEKLDVADNSPLTLIESLQAPLPANSNCWLRHEQAIYPLKIGINTIGRLPDNDVVVSAPYVSRRHCAVLVHTDGTCELHDIASKNGTYLNNRKITGPTRLMSGDEIFLCDSRLVFVSRTEDRQDKVADDTTRLPQGPDA